MNDHIALKQAAADIKLHGLLANWHKLTTTQLSWLNDWFEWEQVERKKRGLERRLRCAKIGKFKPLIDFDWQWPDKIDQQSIEGFMQLDFLNDAMNLIFLGGNGVGKSTIAQNLAYQAAIQGYSVLFTSAANMLNDLAAQDGDMALKRRFKYYAQPKLLVIDEVGYLSYSNRHADLLFEIVNRRYEKVSTIVTTNRPFAEWGDVFPNAACVVSLIDRLIHHSDILSIEGGSYRMKEAKERSAKKQKRHVKSKAKK
ncbi:MAG: IS21-like element helper ATPase IstB [Bacteroidetes bacterium]|nr:IS21-like element helper ATPase IstB [Bacteroidota bacterium]